MQCSCMGIQSWVSGVGVGIQVFVAFRRSYRAQGCWCIGILWRWVWHVCAFGFRGFGVHVGLSGVGVLVFEHSGVEVWACVGTGFVFMRCAGGSGIRRSVERQHTRS